MKTKLIFSAIVVCACSAITVAQSQTPAPSPVEKPLTPARPMKIRVSQGVAEGNLIHKVNPAYPKEAKDKHIEGVVLLKATIDINGNVESLEPISGDPLLVKACVDAVKHWKYRPYLLNGEPITVETSVKIIFHI